jgi:alkanesulfonate monooxygenase SsuD/methylene tetrahydromethanopterin reductase-like flavin-dependent oxidoreductase (luciferase family)
MSEKLRFGVYCEIQAGPVIPQPQVMWDVFHLYEQADHLGYDVGSLIEHHFYPSFGISANPLAFFAALAQKTRRLRFRTLCHVLPLHNPAVLAGEIAQADILTGGRLECGIGRGHAWLYPRAGPPLGETQQRYRECIDILELAWTRERFSYSGEYYQINDTSVVPKPLQKPYPKIYMVGTSGAAVEIAARKGWGLAFGGPVPVDFFGPGVESYREACAKYGTKPEICSIRAVYLAKDEKTAREEAGQHLVNFVSYGLAQTTAALQGEEMKRELVASGYAFYAGDTMPSLGKLSYDDIVNQRIAYVGTPSRVLDLFAETHEKLGVNEISILSHFGNIEYWKAAKTQELFADMVMPRLAQDLKVPGDK